MRGYKARKKIMLLTLKRKNKTNILYIRSKSGDIKLFKGDVKALLSKFASERLKQIGSFDSGSI